MICSWCCFMHPAVAISTHRNGWQTGISLNDDCFDWTAAYRLFTGDVAYVWHAGVHAGEVSAGLVDCGFEIRGQIIWAKPHFVISRGHYHWQHALLVCGA